MENISITYGKPIENIVKNYRKPEKQLKIYTTHGKLTKPIENL